MGGPVMLVHIYWGSEATAMSGDHKVCCMGLQEDGHIEEPKTFSVFLSGPSTYNYKPRRATKLVYLYLYMIKTLLHIVLASAMILVTKLV